MSRLVLETLSSEGFISHSHHSFGSFIVSHGEEWSAGASQSVWLDCVHDDGALQHVWISSAGGSNINLVTVMQIVLCCLNGYSG